MARSMSSWHVGWGCTMSSTSIWGGGTYSCAWFEYPYDGQKCFTADFIEMYNAAAQVSVNHFALIFLPPVRCNLIYVIYLGASFGANGSGTPPERNWRGVIRPCYLLRKAREDVEKFSDARGALKQAMCSMSVTRDQVKSALTRKLPKLRLLRCAVLVRGSHGRPQR